MLWLCKDIWTLIFSLAMITFMPWRLWNPHSSNWYIFLITGEWWLLMNFHLLILVQHLHIWILEGSENSEVSEQILPHHGWTMWHLIPLVQLLLLLLRRSPDFIPSFFGFRSGSCFGDSFNGSIGAYSPPYLYQSVSFQIFFLGCCPSIWWRSHGSYGSC